MLSHLSTSALAQRWGLSEETLSRWRSEGIGPIFLKLGGHIAYRLEDIEAYEQRSLRRSTSEAMSQVTTGVKP